MRLSTKSRYGTRAVMDIAMHAHEGPVTLADISSRQEISRKYLGQIIHQLLAAGILESIRGPQGGYILGRSAKNMKLGEIIRALDGSMAPVRCVDKGGLCHRTPTCAAREVWAELKRSLDAVLDSVTIADLAERQRELDRVSST